MSEGWGEGEGAEGYVFCSDIICIIKFVFIQYVCLLSYC